jgi:hypothetical protein
MLLSTGPFIAVMAGMVVANSLVLDGTAVALHALTGVAGSADRWGRALAYLLLVAPVTGVVWVTSVAINHRWDLAPALFGLTAGLLLASVGGASWGSARYQWPQPPAGGQSVPEEQRGRGGQPAPHTRQRRVRGDRVHPHDRPLRPRDDGDGLGRPGGRRGGPAARGRCCCGWAAGTAGPPLDRRWPEALEAMRRA